MANLNNNGLDFYRKLLNKSISYKELVKSPTLVEHLQKKADLVHKNLMLCDCKVHIDFTADTAFFSNIKGYFLNPLTSVIMDNTFAADEMINRMATLYGLLLHEIGHNAFTSYYMYRNFRNDLVEKKSFFPSMPSAMEIEGEENKKALKNIQEEINNPYVAITLSNFCQTLHNCLEDGRIEYFLMKYCSNKNRDMVQGLILLRKLTKERQLKNISDNCQNMEIYSDSEKYLSLITAMVLYMARFNKLKEYPNLNSKESKAFFENMNLICYHINKYVKSESQIQLYNEMNYIIVYLWVFIKDFILGIANTIDGEPDISKNSSKSNNSLETDNSSKSNNSLETDNSAKANDSLETDNSAKANDSLETDNDLKADDDMETDNGSYPNLSHEEIEEISRKIADILAEKTGTENIYQKLDSDNESQNQGKLKELRLENLNKNLDEMIKTSIDFNSAITLPLGDYEEPNGEGIIINTGEIDVDTSLLTKDLDELTKTINIIKLEKTIDNELINSLNEFKENLNLNDLHKKVNIKISLPKVNDNAKANYEKYAKDIKSISKKALNKIMPLLESEQRNYCKNRYYGTRFNSSNIAKKNLKDFSKKIVSRNKPIVSVGLLVDQSGSMCGEKIHIATLTALVLHNICENANFKVGVFGHNTMESKEINIFCYSDFEKSNSNDKYKIATMKSSGCNRDGCALQFVSERLLEASSDLKLLFIISDGLPNHNGYHGEIAKDDIQNIIAKYESQGIKIVACAIDGDKQSIKEIYGGNRFLDITDLTNLPQKLATLLARNL